MTGARVADGTSVYLSLCMRATNQIIGHSMALAVDTGRLLIERSMVWMQEKVSSSNGIYRSRKLMLYWPANWYLGESKG